MFPQIVIGAFLSRAIPLSPPPPDPPDDSIGYSSILEESWRGLTEEEWRSMSFLAISLIDIDFGALSKEQWNSLTVEQWRDI
jgi:hypothetical protein